MSKDFNLRFSYEEELPKSPLIPALIPALTSVKNENVPCVKEESQTTSQYRDVTVTKKTFQTTSPKQEKNVPTPNLDANKMSENMQPPAKRKKLNQESQRPVDEEFTMTINVGDMDISCLNEEVDLGMEVKIAGLGNTLPLPHSPVKVPRRPKDRDRSKVVYSAKSVSLPDRIQIIHSDLESIDLTDRVKPKGVNSATKSIDLTNKDRTKIVNLATKSVDLSVRERSKTDHSFANSVELPKRAKPKDRDKSKIVSSASKNTTNKTSSESKKKELILEEGIDISSTYIPTINIDEENEISFEDSDDCSVLEVTDTPFYGNRIILGNKKKGESILNERLFSAQVVLEDCVFKLERSKSYCHDCNILFSSAHSLAYHKIKLTNEETKVTKETSVEKIVQKHVGPFVCDICHITFSNLGNMKRHIKNKHGSVENYRQMLTVECQNKNQDTESDVESETEKDDNFCSHCTKVFPDHDSLVKHLYSLLTPENNAVNRDMDLNEIRNEVIRETAVETPTPIRAIETSLEDLDKIREQVIKEATSRLTMNNDSDDNEFDTHEDDYPIDSDSDTAFKCTKCDTELSSKVALAKHELEHTNIEARNAKNCSIEVKNLSWDQIKKFTKKKVSPVKKGKKETLYFKCHFCPLFFLSTKETMYGYHMKNHGVQDYDSTMYPFDGFCPKCDTNQDDIDKFNQHIRNHLYRENHTFQTKPKTKSALKDMFEYKCNICSERFDTNKEATAHIEKSHPDTPVVGNIKKINILKVNKHSLAVHQTIHNPPVPKSVLFKCPTCSVNFFTTFAAAIHLAKCPGPRHYWKCPDCYNCFKNQHKEMHEKQHLYSETFKVYSVGDKNLNLRVLSKCPQCAVHFNEVRFWSHYHDCGREPPGAIYCNQCDILVDSRHYKAHKTAHSKMRTEEFIIIEYEIPGKGEIMKRDDVEALVSKKKKSVKNDSDDEDNGIQLIYCNTCNSYQTSFDKHQICAHFEGRCQKLLKKQCNECGLLFTYRALFHHKNQHEHGFSILNVSFYDLSFKQINPPLPQFPHCPLCKIFFADTEERDVHTCNEMTTLNCDLCTSVFSEAGFKIHKTFHDYPETKVVTPFSRKAIAKIQKMLISKQTKLFTLYKCVDCEVILNEDKVKPHQKLVFECVTMKNLYRTCPHCKLTFHSEDYHEHLRKHDDEKFTRRNMKIVPFDRRSEIIEINKNDESDSQYIFYQCAYCERCLEEYKPSYTHACASAKIWCSKCNIYISAVRNKKHRYDHTVYPDMNSETIKIIRFNEEKVEIKRKQKGVKITEDDTSSDDNTSVSDDNSGQKDTITLYRCKDCKISFLKETVKHKCEPKAKTKLCNICENIFHIDDYNKHKEFHRSNPDYNDDQIEVIHFRNKYSNKQSVDKDARKYKANMSDEVSEENKQIENIGKTVKDNTTKEDKVKNTIDTIYKCTCGLHFLTEKGIIVHFSGCCNKKAKKQICTKCNLLFTPPVLFNHLVTHHAKNRTFTPKILEMNPKCLTDKDVIYKCSKCELHFLSKTIAETHDETCSRKSVPPCDTCGLQFEESMMAYHKRRHHMYKMFVRNDFDVIVCGETNKKTVHFPKEIEEEDDEIETRNKTIFKCVQCDVYFLTGYILKYHTNGEHKLSMQDVVHCKKCDKTFANYRQHVQDHHERDGFNPDDFIVRDHWNTKMLVHKTDNRNILYGCEECNLFCLNKESLYRHVLLSEHKLKGPIQRCDTCKKFFVNSAQLRTHIKLHHTELNIDFEDFEIKTYPMTEGTEDDVKYSNKLYRCIKCSVCMMSVNEKNVHNSVLIVKCPPNKVRDCKDCGLQFSHNVLLEHTRYHHHVKGYKVDDFKIIKIDYAKKKSKSVARNDDRKIYKCRSCSVHYYKKRSCLRHVSKHIPLENDQKKTCSRCNIVFHSKSLKVHRLRHHKEKKLTPNELVVNEYDPDNLKKGIKILYRHYTGCKSVVPKDLSPKSDKITQISEVGSQNNVTEPECIVNET